MANLSATVSNALKTALLEQELTSWTTVSENNTF